MMTAMRMRGHALLMASSSSCPSFRSLSRRVPFSSSSLPSTAKSYRLPLVSSRSFRAISPSSDSRLKAFEAAPLSCGGSRARLGGVRASHEVSGAGSIDSSMMQSMESKIKDQLNAETVIVKDAYGDGRHVSIYVVSAAFDGQSAVNRQRMVYKAIWEELQTTVHAVDQMVTYTPAEANKSQ